MTIPIEQGLVYRLLNDGGVSGIIGARLYAQKLPQDPIVPALTYQLITPMSIMSHQGASGTARPRFQITGWDMTEQGVEALMSKVRICLNGFKGNFGAGGNTVAVYASLLVGGYETVEPGTGLFMRAQDYYLWHEEVLT